MMHSMDHGEGPRELLERFRRAAIDQSVEDLSGLYAVDAVHEFPFNRPGVPARLEGREEIAAFMVTGWRRGALKYENYRTIALHETADPQTIVVEQEAVGRSEAGREFALPNIVVLTVIDGEIAHFRDYVNVLAVNDAVSDSE